MECKRKMKCYMCILRKKKFPKRFSVKDIEFASERCDFCLKPTCRYELFKARRNKKSRKPIHKICPQCYDNLGFYIVFSFIKSNNLSNKHITALKRIKKEYDKQKNNIYSLSDFPKMPK